MFTPFFYTCRAKGLKVSMSEWLTLQEALQKNLAESSLTQFYYMARAILVKSETDFDKFDLAFEECFKGIKSEDAISLEMLRWLDKTEFLDMAATDEQLYDLNMDDAFRIDKDAVEEEFRKKQEEQNGEHNGGCQWIGTMGKTAFGNSGGNVGGMRIGGKSGHQSAFAVMGERKFKDFRDDRVLDKRQYQLAFRRLRQFSSRMDAPKTELDIPQTIHQTCNNGGMLQIVMDKPRKNAVKLMLLFDSGGTMIPYSALMNDLFQAVNKSNHFKDVKCYYFHNCIYGHLYNTPECENGDWVDTEWIFRNLDSDYKVIIVGDAAMAPEELYADNGNYRGPNGGLPGIEWLKLMKSHYKRIIWLNPKMAAARSPWREAEYAISGFLPMYRLTLEGLNEGMKYLMSNKKFAG